MLHKVRHLVEVEADGRDERKGRTTSSRPPALTAHASASPRRGSAPARPPAAGQKGYGSRSGAKDRARFEGGQNPIHMRMRKLRGRPQKMSMPFEPFRTHHSAGQPRGPGGRFDAGRRGDPDTLKGRVSHPQGLAVKILARGELQQALTVTPTASARPLASASKRAGGTCVTIDD